MRKGFYFFSFWLIPFSQKHAESKNLSGINILRDSIRDLKISTRSLTVGVFNWLRRKNFLPENMHNKYVEVWDLIDSSLWLILLYRFFGGNSCRQVLDGQFFKARCMERDIQYIWCHAWANWENFYFSFCRYWPT